MTSSLLRTACDRVNRLPRSAALRAGDALHATAAEHGFEEIYTNDRHLMAACPHFGLRGVDVITSP
jgi:predicted nucleic acid-binding protein